AVVDAHHAAFLAFQRLLDLLVAVAVFRTEFGIKRQVAAIEPGPDCDHRAFGNPWLLYGGRRQLEAQHIAAAIETAAIQNERAVAVVDARTGFGRRNQPA